MNAGDEMLCPNCKKESFLVIKRIIDGWKIGKEILVCSHCKCEISIISKEEKNRNISTKKLAAFLGEEDIDRKDIEKSDGVFCKNCKHFILHPFLSRCALHKRNTEPMSDCEDFKLKPII